MGQLSVFEWVCDELERRTSLNRLQARGTVRIAAGQVVQEAENTNRTEMIQVLYHLMPKELELRGFDDGQELCRELAEDLQRVRLTQAPSPRESPDVIFDRLFGAEPKTAAV